IHLIPKISEECGIDNKEIKIDTSAVERLIEEYSRESGVRNLKKYIEKIFRRGAVKMIKSQQTECDDTNVESKCVVYIHLEIFDIFLLR
ncbi:MAG: Lon protease mitochondrial, partial [Marteilia pararefringens]